MDSLDVGILRELSRDQILWFGRLDPRISAAEISRRLRVDRATVGARLHDWERSGFLRGHEVVPSPLVFNARIAGGNLRVTDLRKKPEVLNDLTLIPGLISAVDHVGDWIALLYAYEEPRALERSRKLLERLPGVGEATPCVPFHPPEPTVVPTSLDFRILDDLKSNPRRNLQQIAKSVRISSKSLVRRLTQLVQGRAIWYLPILDFTRYRKSIVARFVVALKAGGDASGVATAARQLVPNMTYLVDTTSLSGPGVGIPSMLDLSAHLDSLGQVEDVQLTLQNLESVESVEVLFPRRFYLYREWFDEQIRTAVGRHQGKSVREA